MNELRKYLWLSQITWFSLLVLCTALIPSVAIHNGGVSNFGNHISTVVPYVMGFVLNIAFIYLAAGVLKKLGSHWRRLAQGLVVLCVLESLVLLSTFPRHYSFTFSYIHDYLGVAQFSWEFLISIWVVLKSRAKISGIFLGLEAIGMIVGLLSIYKVIHFLYIGQIVGTIGFGLILTILIPHLVTKRDSQEG